MEAEAGTENNAEASIIDPADAGQDGQSTSDTNNLHATVDDSMQSTETDRNRANVDLNQSSYIEPDIEVFNIPSSLDPSVTWEIPKGL